LSAGATFEVPSRVLAAYGLEGAALAPIAIGLVNQTFRVEDRGGRRAILQRLHPAFAPEVNLDIEAITAHLAARGVATPRLVRTARGEPFVEAEGTWRVLTFLEGRTFLEVESPSLARAAGGLAGRFHWAMSGFSHRFAFTREGAHDTPRHLRKLAGLLESARDLDEETRAIGQAVLAHGLALAPLPETRRRIVHGDLKITNLLFEPSGGEGLALLDLDTMAHGTLPVELGDALRSWSNPRGESDVDARCDLAIVEAALEGFVATCGDLDDAELLAVPLGLETIAAELAARFAADAIEDRYFGWDRERFESRPHHNRVRARSQLALARSVARQRGELEGLVRRLASR
jgi:Ser/Thr protein kinase RdoA (MazF antagonist)